MPDSITHLLSAVPRDRHAHRDGAQVPVPKGHGFALHLGQNSEPALAALTRAMDPSTVEPAPLDGADPTALAPADAPQVQDVPPHMHFALVPMAGDGAQMAAATPAGLRGDDAVLPAARPGDGAGAGERAAPAGLPVAVQAGAQPGPAATPQGVPNPQATLPGVPAPAMPGHDPGHRAATVVAPATPADQAMPAAVAQVVARVQGQADILTAPDPRRKIATAPQQLPWATAEPDLPVAHAARVAPVMVARSGDGTYTFRPQQPLAPGASALAAPPPPLDAVESAAPRHMDASAALASTSAAPPTTAGGQPAALPNAASAAPTAQLAQALAVATTDSFEIALSPEELGRVRIHLQPTEAGVQVLIQTERPETLELLRKNIALLSRDLADLGFEDLSFQFSQQQNPSSQAPERLGALAVAEDEPVPTRPVASAGAATLLQPARGMDLRF